MHYTDSQNDQPCATEMIRDLAKSKFLACVITFKPTEPIIPGCVDPY